MKLKKFEHKMKKAQENTYYIHWKQQFYDDILSGKTKYYNNLILTKNNDIL